MADQKLRVVATLKVKPESREWAIENAFKDLVEQTKKEEGCISYILHNDVKESNTFVFVEEWRSQADIDTHNKSPHLVEAITKLKEHFTAAPIIRVIKPLL